MPGIRTFTGDAERVVTPSPNVELNTRPQQYASPLPVIPQLRKPSVEIDVNAGAPGTSVGKELDGQPEVEHATDSSTPQQNACPVELSAQAEYSPTDRSVHATSPGESLMRSVDELPAGSLQAAAAMAPVTAANNAQRVIARWAGARRLRSAGA